MAPALWSLDVAAVLDRLHAAAAVEDPAAAKRVREREESIGTKLPQAQRYELYGGAPLAIKREVGELLYVLVVSRGASRVVEFGASLGVSTIYLAAALDDAGGSPLITTEQLPDKAQALSDNVRDAGFEDLVEVRVGDAMETLADVTGPIDFLFLDGRNDLYLSMLRMLEPQLASDAMVVADLSADDPDLLPYLDYVRDRAGRYVSVTVPLDAGVELSVHSA